MTLRCSLRAILDFLAMCLALLSEFDVLADLGVVLLQDHAVRIVTTVLAGYVGVTRARGRLELDDRPYVLVLSHSSFTPRARMSATTASLPRTSMVLMPLAETCSVTLRRRDGTQ